ncbi:MAG: ATP-binding protein [Chitinophagaceae bacterium]
MKLRTKYILFVGIIHLLTLVLAFFIFSENKLFFIAAEILVIISIIIAWQVYNQLLQPLKLLMQGVDAIRDRDFSIKFSDTGKYEMDKLISVYNTMIDELREERTKQEQQHFFLEKLINTSPTGIIILDYDLQVHQLNPKALRILGLNEKDVLRHPIPAIDHPLMHEISKLSSGESKTITISGIETFKLQKSHFIDRGFPRYFILLEELTVEILIAEKNTYGRVIRMMAHEVNNTIGPVNSILQSTLQSQQHPPAIQNALEVATERNNNLNAFMRNFADLVRLPPPAKRSVDLHKLIHDVHQLMQLHDQQKQISFVFELSSQPVQINADPLQMEQALINIVKNAIEAISGNGTITFITKNRQLIIRDTGKGITQDLEGQLFSPFFSTKKDGQGIGLTLTRDILLNHGFEFSLKTPAPGNTAFSISF